MRWIYPAYAAVEKICGPQRYAPDRPYRLSDFCLSAPCEEGTLLFHTLMGSLCLLEAGETAEDCREALAIARYLVPTDFDERRYADTVRRLLQVAPPKKGKTSFTVFTTTDCNARCAYCYEKGIPRFSMTEQVAHDAAAYIARVSEGQEVSLHWFGGEPLYNVPAIDVVSEDLTKAGVSFHSHITSNGYFLDQAMARRAVEKWRLEMAQITLDGTEKVYNRTKAYIRCEENAFERVLRNIDHALEAGVRVYLRLNMDARNADDLMALADVLAERFSGRTGLSVYPVLLKTFVDPVRGFDTQEEALDRYRRLEDKLAQAGVGRRYTFTREIRANRCLADNDGCEVILPDGRIGKCEHYSEKDVVGSIYDDARDEAMLRAWKQRREPFPACGTCVLYPRCVNLERCDWTRDDDCPLPVRHIRRERLTEQILAAYRERAGKETGNGPEA